jgi:hypothetical protein
MKARNFGFGLVLAIVVLVAVYLGTFRSRDAGPSYQPVPFSGVQVGPAPIRGSLTSEETRPLPGTTTPTPKSRAEQIDRWMLSGAPEDAFRAYLPLAQCALRQWVSRRNPSVLVGEVCDGLRPDQLARRMELVERAAAAHVPGATHQLLAAGPNGDIDALETRPDDLLVVEWKARTLDLLQLSAQAGDIDAFATLSHVYEQGVLSQASRELALRYQVAFKEAQQFRNGKPPSPASAALIAQLSQGMPKEVAARESEAGKRLAEHCCKR